MIEEAVALYGVEPTQFVAARNQLVRQLKADKRKDDAAVVAKLPRPRVGEYIVNRVAREHPEVVRAFAAAVAAATSAQSSAIGTGDGAALRSTSTDLRNASAALVEAALRQVQRDGLDGAGRRDEILGTVRSLTNEAGAALLVAGVVGSGVEPGDTDLFAGAPEPRDVPKQAPAAERKQKAASKPKTAPAAAGAAEPSEPPASRASPEPAKPSAAELARQRRHDAQVDKAKAALTKARREVAAAQRAMDAAATRLSRAEDDEREAAIVLDDLTSSPTGQSVGD